VATTLAEVKLWGTTIGAVTWLDDQQLAEFQYSDALIGSGIEPCPITMPVRQQPYRFPNLSKDSFKGLPGLLADMLPDKFGNALINQWLSRQGRDSDSFNPVERLCYVGNRGMGALEFEPAERKLFSSKNNLDVAELVALASDILRARKFDLPLKNGFDESTLSQILEVGTSAGGARAKAVIAWNEKTGTVRSGHIPPTEGFTYWLLKFDGVDENSDKELNDPQGYGRIEYAYHLCAKSAGINMTECRLLEEGGRAHFLTKRFDRSEDGAKRHMLSLCGIAHFDYQMAGASSYEQAFQICKKLALPMEDKLQLFRRMVFNLILRNQDDHTKNIAFLMDRRGKWRLAPAYDMVFSYNPKGAWTAQHQMTVNGKRDNFTKEDLLSVANNALLNRSKCREIIEDVRKASRKWEAHAEESCVSSDRVSFIRSVIREL